jgi:hypothetical protein
VNKNNLHNLGPWLMLAGIIVAFYLSLYAVVHQINRSLADEPQVQLAEDLAYEIDNGISNVEDFEAINKVEISRSLAPYVIIYDIAGNVRASTAVLHGEAPKVPIGVLEHARENGQNRVTWEPEKGVRSAVVAEPLKDGYLLAGRSLRESGEREKRLATLIAIAGLITLMVMSAVHWLVIRHGKGGIVN